MANTYAQILKAGTQAAYDALGTKETSVLYFCTDTGKMYKGEVDFTNSVIYAASKPTAPVVGKVYILADTNTVEAYVNGSWSVLSYPVATAISSASDDVHVASAKAVYDAIQAAIADVTGGDIMVKDVVAGTDAATLVVQKAGGSETTITVPGVVTTPTWDATARKLTLPVAGGTAVEINIGKDIFLDTEADNKYNAETGNIELHLNDGTTIEVPASALVDTHTGAATKGATVSVSDANVITVDLIVDPDTKNALVLGENGLMVDLSAYAKTTEVEAHVSNLQGQIDTVKTTADKAATDIGVLNGDASTEGSVKKQVADAKAALQAEIEANDADILALQNKDTAHEASIQANTDDIAALAAATTTWGTF